MSTPSLTKALVRILEHDREPREPVGAGFLVTPHHILTCAHVVESALGMTPGTQELPTQQVFLDFPLLERHPILKAQVIHWSPVKEHPTVGEPEDIAVLELTPKPPLPTAAHPVPLVKLDDELLFAHPVRMCGFPRGMDNGDWVDGELKGLIGTGRIQLAHDVGRRAVAKGFSGTGVWDTQEHAVAGMIVEIQTRAGDTSAYMIPASTLLKAWPDLDQHSRPSNPYRGLKAFRIQDAPYFFGRDEVIQSLQQKVREHPFVPVIGASGSGKSSIVFAGLVPSLDKEENWLIDHFRPRKQPFRELAWKLVQRLYIDQREQFKQLKAYANDLESGKIDLSDIMRSITQAHSGKRYLLIVDQFEELYTLTPDKASQCRFVDRLLQPVQSQNQSANFTLLTAIRADFMGQAVSYGPFAKVLNTHPVEILKQMDERELRSAIEQPAQKMGVVIEQGLTERILQDLGQEPGNLPLLEFALTQLWERQIDRKLAHAAYTDIGGVNEALAHHADEVYGRFDAAQQENLRHVLLQLVRPGEGTEDTRQMATRDQIRIENWDLVTQLADARLVVTGRNEETGEETAEVVHEALILHWQPLRKWMDADREFRIWQTHLRQATQGWEKTGKDEGALLRGARLAEAEEKLRKYDNELSFQEKIYIKASISLHEKEIENRERVQRERERFQQRIQRINRYLKIFLVAALGLLVLVVWQWSEVGKQREKAVKQGEIAKKRGQELEQALRDVKQQRQKAENQRQIALEAQEKAEKARQLAERKVEELELTFDITNTGVLYGSLSKYYYQKLLAVYQHSLATNREHHDLDGISNDLARMGIVYQHMGQYQKALECYQESQKIHHKSENRKGESDDLASIGQVYYYIGQYQKASEFYQQARDMKQKIGDRPGKAVILSHLGKVNQVFGEYQKALDLYQEALVIRREMKDRYGEGIELSNIGQIHHNIGQYQEALEYHQKALTIQSELGDRRGKAITFSNLGEVYQSLSEHEKALDFYNQALTIRREIGDRHGEGTVLSNIGVIYSILGQYQDALTYHQLALSIRQEIGDLHGQSKDLCGIGQIYEHLEKYEEARSTLERSVVILMDLNVPSDLRHVQICLSSVEAKLLGTEPIRLEPVKPRLPEQIIDILTKPGLFR